MRTSMEAVFGGKYEVLKQVGRGGMSVVYLAMDKHLNKQWAIKETPKKAKDKNGDIFVQSLMTEANLMKRLDHPAIPRIVDIVENDEAIYVVMDYIEGNPLSKSLEEYGAQPQEYVIDWAKQLCDALFCEVNPIPVKKAMNLLGKCSDGIRRPLTVMEYANVERLRNAMENYGILSSNNYSASSINARLEKEANEGSIR